MGERLSKVVFGGNIYFRKTGLEAVEFLVVVWIRVVVVGMYLRLCGFLGRIWRWMNVSSERRGSELRMGFSRVFFRGRIFIFLNVRFSLGCGVV